MDFDIAIEDNSEQEISECSMSAPSLQMHLLHFC